MSGEPVTGVKAEAVLQMKGALEPKMTALERTPLFHALPRRHRRKVAGLAVVRQYEHDDAIVRAGEPGDAFHVVLDGEIRVVTPEGEELRCGAGDHFGELALIDGAPRTATVSAVGPVTAASLSRDDFQRLLHDEPGFAVGLLPGLALIARDLMQIDAQRVVDHAKLGDWVGSVEAGPPRAEAIGALLEGRDALGWLVVLRHVAVFEAVPERHLQKITHCVNVERYADGANVVVAGARGDSMHIILDGRARVRTPSGHTAVLGEDDCYGELALIDGAPRSATVTAVGELTTAMVTRKEFQKLLKSEPEVAVGLLDGLVRTIRDMQQTRPRD
jgi:CRP-like cAMP-binding protein